MANEVHLNVVKSGVSAIDDWRKDHRHEALDLRGADLSETNLRRVNLSRARLRGADLHRSDLSDADLSRANLHRATLSQADLTGSILYGTDLSEADLSGARLRGSDLHLANLSLADLLRADLRGVDLSGANLIDANLNGTDLSSAGFYLTVLTSDLSGTTGLSEVEHQGPSLLGVSALQRSRGKIPEIFLRGCGLSDWEIAAAKLHAPDLDAAGINTLGYELINLRSKAVGFSFYSAFISYSHEDKDFARALHDALQDRGVRCWRDDHQIRPGEKIMRRVDEGIRLWDKVLLCCSKDSLASWWVDKEIGMAFAKEERLWKERGVETLSMIPLNLDGSLFKWEHPRGTEIRERMAPDFAGCPEDEEKFRIGVGQLVEALREDAGSRPPPPQPKL